MAEKLDIVVIGNIINEMILFPDKTIGPVLGSPAAYSSIAMSAAGAAVGLVSYYGPDLSGLIEGALFKTDQRGMILTEKSTMDNLIYREDGTKKVEYMHKAPSIQAKDIPAEYLECEQFYICPMDYEVDIGVNKMLHSTGKNVVVDMGGYGGATSADHLTIFQPEGEEIVSQVAKYCTVMKASREDLTHIAPGMELDDICDYFFARGTKTCVVTLGSKGSFYRRAGEKGVYVKNIDGEKPIDFTGAGDSFGAGLMVSLSRGKDIGDALLYGNALASIVIEKSGGCVWERMPSNERIMERIELSKGRNN